MRIESGAQRRQVQVAVDAAELAATSMIPGARQRSVMFPFCQLFTLARVGAAMGIIDSMLLVDRQQD